MQYRKKQQNLKKRIKCNVVLVDTIWYRVFKVVGKTFKLAGIDVSYVVSSPSCRARETAIFAFNRIDQIEPSILHRTAQMKSQYKELGEKFRQVIDDIPLKTIN